MNPNYNYIKKSIKSIKIIDKLPKNEIYLKNKALEIIYEKKKAINELLVINNNKYV